MFSKNTKLTYINPNTDHQINTTVFHVRGLIQGVGFRPFIYRIARELSLNGNVHNQNDGVVVYLQGPKEKISSFQSKLNSEAPPAAIINDIEISTEKHPPYTDFTIVKSKSVDNTITLVSPDIAVCENCLRDMKVQKHRIDYPFINCTNCGPRFSIIEDIPYDRPFTSMKKFEMCPVCNSEYTDVLDRRFHAQPVACTSCGPEYELQYEEHKESNTIAIIQKLQALLTNGKLIAMKGLGGYHLVCDAFNKHAVSKLRKVKERDGKPFALMFGDIDTLKKYASVSEQEDEILTSWKRPIVLVEAKSASEFPYELANGLGTLGVFLPYLPFHHQLFENLGTDALVMTSGNISDCPIITENSDAIGEFASKVDAVLLHNRSIVNRVDDSVVQEDELGIQILRRARGYAPLPVQLNFNVEGILATGAELSNAFAIGKDNQAILSQHIGDLKNLETMEFFEQSVNTLSRLFKFTPQKVACDMHPDYLSTRFAENLGIPVLHVQHHHAHIAAVMAEYNLNDPVIGISYDGTGYGTDGKIWGSEILVADFSGFERKYHFEYVPIPGGDKVSKEPWRSALSYAFQAFDGNIKSVREIFNDIPASKFDLLVQALKANINTPESCSAGRLFDAISGLTNICQVATYHAEAPIRLEHALHNEMNQAYPIDLNNVISWKKVIQYIVEDINEGVDTGIISTKFHNTVANVTIEAVKQLNSETGIKKVILSGGTFQNKYLTKKVVDLMQDLNLEVFISRQVPCNDGGIALGQLAIAASQSIRH